MTKTTYFAAVGKNNDLAPVLHYSEAEARLATSQIVAQFLGIPPTSPAVEGIFDQTFRIVPITVEVPEGLTLFNLEVTKLKLMAMGVL